MVYRRDVSQMSVAQRVEAQRQIHDEIRKYRREVDWVGEVAALEKKIHEALSRKGMMAPVEVAVLWSDKASQAVFERLPLEVKSLARLKVIGRGEEYD